MPASPLEYTIGGVKIQFPRKAYPSQLAMMNSIIRGLNTGQHCLLESPTGSGKSLALLCSTLGWQQAQYVKLQEGRNPVGEKGWTDKSFGDCKKLDGTNSSCQCVCHSRANVSASATAADTPAVVDLTVSPCKESTLPPPAAAAGQRPSSEGTQAKKPSLASRLSQKFQVFRKAAPEEDDDFQPDRKRLRTPEQKSCKRQRLEQGVIFIDDDQEPENVSPGWTKSQKAGMASPCCATGPCTQCSCASKDGAKDQNSNRRVPKIFFGTRTHKQITQVAHELRRTVYSKVPMTILSSRDHTCVNPEVAPHSKRNELCKERLEAKDGRSCRYYHGVQKMGEQYLLQQVHGVSEAWDIEDLVSLGKRLRSCSYFAARELMAEAVIIFCPYNYLLDPLIRESMDINLSGQILVLDEAHNIEDCARESASFTVNYDSLLASRDELESMVKNKIREAKHEPLQNFCYSLINWIQESQSLMSERGYESASKVWSGRDIVGIFHTLGITDATFNMLKANLAAVLEKEERLGFVNGKEDVVQIPTISSATSAVLKGLFMVLDYLFRDKCRFAEDYRVALQKSYAWTNQVPPDAPDAQGFFVRPRQRQRQSIRVKAEMLTLSFWCLNPAVAFSDLSNSLKSIVLTSGTLSPMGSFSSELGVKFSIQLEANHVINKSQVWVGTVGAGPHGRKLCATFQHAETYTFQDEVGALLLHVCQVMAKGVLCFLPSYKMLDKLRDRWSNTGLWEKLEQQKTVITEPRGGGKGDFDELLQTYYEAIKGCQERDGALLIAVCRGKVSEGLDFTDDNARAVVTIGIPFPNIKDLQVELKMKYNDQHAKSRGLLSGHRWYEIQAYRALNQALGRCIRHRNDWGALILVDDRYKNNPNKYITGLSKWVRQLVQHHDTFSNAMQSLGAFSREQQKVALIPADARTSSSTAASPHSHVCVTVEDQAAEPCSTASLVETPAPQQDAAHSVSNIVPHTQVKSGEVENAECSRMLPIPPPAAPLLNPKARAVHPIFTSSPVRPSLKKPIFKGKPPSNSSLPLEMSDFEDKEGQITSSSKDNEAGLIKAEVPDTFREVEEKTDAGAAFSDWEDGPPGAAGAGEEDEDETIFFTPELFEDPSNGGSPHTEPTTEPPPGTRGPAACSDEPFEKVQGGASCTGESPVSESERKKPEGEREGIRGEKEGVEGGQVDNQSRKTDKWLHRVSRSRQKVPSSPTGGGREARCVGRASRQIQISRQRTGRTRAGDEPQLAAPAAEISRAAQAGKKNRQDNICVNGMTGRLSMSTRGGKALKEERFPSTMTWSDLMTPGEDDLGWLHKAPRPAVGGPESKRGNRSKTLPILGCCTKQTKDIFPLFRTRVGMDGDCQMYIFWLLNCSWVWMNRKLKPAFVCLCEALRVRRSRRPKKRRRQAASQKTKARTTSTKVDLFSISLCTDFCHFLSLEPSHRALHTILQYQVTSSIVNVKSLPAVLYNAVFQVCSWLFIPRQTCFCCRKRTRRASGDSTVHPA
ncbi:Fanconi anemia group J protein isoform X1 [Takifugu flavidus]|uniref:Fanconi anemia group J protein isoform X1 n=1 Tax=Takifugu flavidus TaxID=433684 RepID=UPI002544402F|nr:Fanconi anemia group J protein isoform X1 [Takifugu flavidus]